jgi:AcrR family transcriptional regulator
MATRKPAARRTRRTRPPTSDKRARILAAARGLFIGEGWAAFTTRRVARAAGVSLGSLQYFFPSKEQLLAGTLEEVIDGYVRRYAELEGRLPARGPERLLAVVDYLVDDLWRPETRKFFLNLLALGCHDAFAARLVNDIYARYRQRLATYIAVARPDLAERECLDRGLQIATLILGTHVYTAPDARAVSSRAHLAELVRGSVQRLID